MDRRTFIGAMAAAGGFVGLAYASGRAPKAIPRRVLSTVAGTKALVGDVLRVRRTLPGLGVEEVDPFVLLDHFDFTMQAGELGGLAPHPHRGIETVTVVLEGALEHGDSIGNRAVLESGDVQWMTAGSGIVHEENPADIIRERGGRIHGVQLWVNLPAASKRIAPGYQDRKSTLIPSASEGGVDARIIAGALDDVVSELRTQSPLALFDVTAKPGALVSLAQPIGWSAFVHVVEGDVQIEGTAVGAATLANLDRDGSEVRFTAGSRGARVLVGGGSPIAEPMSRRGPFIMNTDEEIDQAFADYRAGRMGKVANPTYDRIGLKGR